MAASNKKSVIHVLHVDDDLCNLEVSKQILLTENNFEIENATSVDEAFKKMEKQLYDAIVSDYEMPQKNGLEFLKELREKNNQIPFILFTGKGREDVAVKALNLGADSYLNKNGSPETVYCELADVINKTVERKKSRKLLVKSEAKYRTLVEKSLQGILVTKVAPLRLVFANEAMGKILGYSPQELLSLSPEGIMGLVYHEERAVFFKRMENRLRGETTESCFEFRAVRKDGSTIWLSALSNRVEYDEQPAVQGMFLDVSESKKTGEILRESEQRYRELANCLPDINYESDTTGKLEFVNERALEIAGITHEDFEKGLNILQFVAPEDRERATKSIQRLIAGGSYVPAEYTFVRKNGTTFPALITTTLRISKNKVTGLRGLVIDITESKKAEENLQKEHQELNRIIDSSPIIIFYKNTEGKFIRVNEAFAEAQKIPKEKFLGKTVFDFYSDEIARGMANDDLEVLKSGSPKLGIIEHYESASGMKCVQTDKVPIFDKNGIVTGLVGFAQDITERKKLEDAIKEKLDILEALTENIGAGFVTISKDYHVLYANKFVKNNVGNVEGKPCYATLNTLDHVCPDCGVKKVFEDGVARDSHEYSQIGVDGNPYFVELIATPLKDKDGNVTAGLEFVVDISARKKAEEALKWSMNKLVLVNEKLNVVGGLTRHDVRNKLSAVTGYAFLLKKKHPDQADIIDGLGKMEQAIKEIETIFDFAKIYEQIGVEELTYINVEETFNEALALFSGSLNVKVINDCHELTLLADSFVRQLFFNLIDNSVKHGKKASTIKVSYKKADQDRLNLIYEDDGIGISADNKSKLFQSGFSTAGTSGYGLYLIRKMIEVYGWIIQENGEPGKGAKLTITIPKLSKNGKENYQIVP